MRWTAGGVEDGTRRWVAPPLGTAVRRGVANRCPYCGVGRVFAGYLRLVPECAHCGAPLGRLRADDAPPYFTIFLVGHLLVPGVFMVEKAYQPPMWLHMVIWLPLFTVLCILMLRPIKGAVVGWMSTLGIGSEDEDAAEPAKAEPRLAEPRLEGLPDRNA
ncbi:DUF983 domain-containing protein [Belnapia sp. T6]|uniref:DUF983 domain-containing protein n=1 Tax=Belnapia mucosa TaxID=2804532 RepID=A0ABS1UW59_9PROT|nr:DUF983 domain-containing protein [Belnapia mucosa]MBL6453720.1 DUF983 domain-containing protein [Belnapia mucosa]